MFTKRTLIKCKKETTLRQISEKYILYWNKVKFNIDTRFYQIQVVYIYRHNILSVSLFHIPIHGGNTDQL